MADETMVTDSSEVVDSPVEEQVIEAPAEETQASDETASTDHVVEDETQDIDPANPTAPIPYAKVKGLVEKLKTEDPQLAKELKNLVFEKQALAQLAPGGVPQIKKALETFETLGGEEGIQKIEEQKAEWAGIDEKFAAGDATVLDTFAQFNPEGFVKLVPGVLDKLSTIDRGAYDRTLSGIFLSTLDNMRFMDSLERIYENLSQVQGENGQPKFAREIGMLQGLAKGYDDLRKLATTAPKKEISTEQQKLEAERAKFAAEQTKAHGDYVANETKAHATQKYETLIAAEAKAQGLKVDGMKDSPAYQRMMNEIDQAVAQEIVKDKAAVSKIQAAISAGRRGDAVKLSNAKFDQVAAKAIQKVVREWAGMLNPARPAKKPAPNGSAPVPAGVKKLDTPPNLSLVDKSYPEWKDNFYNGQAKLTTGQRVTW